MKKVKNALLALLITAGVLASLMLIGIGVANLPMFVLYLIWGFAFGFLTVAVYKDLNSKQ